MQRRLSTLTLLGFCALALSACSSPGHRSLAHSKTFSPRVNVEKRGDGQRSLTETGRVHLAADQLGLAMELFRDALTAGEAPAPAFNGLGVAYAQLGRADLAKLYFAKAMASDPANPHFAENLARLTRTEAMMQKTALAAAPEPALATASPIQRLSPGEVRIVTAPTASRQQLASTREPAVINRLSRGEVRIATTGPATALPAKSRSPIRIEFASMRRDAATPKSRTITFASR